MVCPAYLILWCAFRCLQFYPFEHKDCVSFIQIPCPLCMPGIVFDFYSNLGFHVSRFERFVL